MNDDFNAYHYCGLVLRSTLPLPELPACTDTGAADVILREAPVPSHLPNASLRTVTFDVTEGEAIYRLEGIARYRVAEGGRLIEVDFAPRAEAAAARLFLLDPVFALAAVMRGEYLLRAATVAIDGHAVAFVGPSAAGKSTAVGALAAAGHPILSDHLLRVAATDSGQVLAYPQAPWLHLWPDVVEHLCLDAVSESVRAGIPLRRVRFQSVDAPLPLSHVAVLRKQSGDDLDLFERLPRTGRRGFTLLTHYTAGNTWLGDLRRQRLRHFQWAVRIAGAAAIGALEVPWDWQRLAQFEKELMDWCGRAGDAL